MFSELADPEGTLEETGRPGGVHREEEKGEIPDIGTRSALLDESGQGANETRRYGVDKIRKGVQQFERVF
jgi:hypothetical protein